MTELWKTRQLSDCVVSVTEIIMTDITTLLTRRLIDTECSRMSGFALRGMWSDQCTSHITAKNATISNSFVLEDQLTNGSETVYFMLDRRIRYSGSLRGWTVRESNPSGGEISRTRPDRPLRPPNLP